MSAKGTLAYALAALLLAGTDGLAQSCIGVPVTDRGMALTGNASFGANAKAYGAGVRANIQGPLSLGAGFAQTDIEELANNFSTLHGDLAFEIEPSGISVCPVTGLSYSWFRGQWVIFAQPLRVTTLVIPIGLAVGKTLSTSEQVTITPFAIPQYLYVRTTLKDAESDADYGTETEHEWGAMLGISVGGRRLFGTLGAELTSAGDWEPALSLGVGLILR